MKKAMLLIACLASINAYATTTSIISTCDGKFETGQAVHVKIDWDNKAVRINKFNTFIQSVVYYGIVTATYKNSLNIETFSIVGHLSKAGTFIAQQQMQYGQIITTNFARLTCSESFYKPFTDKLLDA